MVHRAARDSTSKTHGSTALTHDGHFSATFEDGTQRQASSGDRRARHRPLRPHARVGSRTRVHTCDLVDFSSFHGARVLIVGGRQSAYEWAALARRARRGSAIDVVHRHAQPRFERVSWRFVDPLVERTLATRGWWREPPADRARRDRPPLLGGRPADARALAQASPGPRAGPRPREHGGQLADHALRRHEDRPGPDRLRHGLQGRPREGPVPRAAAGRHRATRRLPGPRRRDADDRNRPLHPGFRRHPGLRPVLRLRQGRPRGGPAGRTRVE